MNKSNRTYGIIGGGVIGWSIAYQLAKTRTDSRESIIVFESEMSGSSSWAGAGILPPAPSGATSDPLEALQQLSRQAWPEWSAELKQRTGIDNQFHVCGGVYVARSAGEHASLLGLQQFWNEVGIVGRPLPKESWAQQYPWFAKQLPWDECRLLFEVPDEAQLRNPRHLSALRAASESMGVETCRLDADQAARLMLHSQPHSGVAVTRGTDESYSCERLVLAAGSWTSLLLQRWFGETHGVASVYPVKGEMLLFKSPGPLFSQILNVGTRYIVPRLDGHVLVGSTELEAGYHSEPTEEARSQLLEFARQTLPQLLELELVQHWAGLRPASFDQMPIMGPLSFCPELIVASGHFRSGLQWSIGTAMCVAALLRNEVPPIDLRVFRPGR
jgi:glycine oxidase